MKKMLLYQQQWLRALFSLFFGLSGTLAFSPFDFWIAALCSLFGLQLLIVNCSSKQASCIAFCWGMGLFCSGINWIYMSLADFSGLPKWINIFLVILLAAYLSLYSALFAYLLNRFFPVLNIARFIFAAPAIWQITEYLRSWVLTGFPWLQFGYSQINGPLKGIAPIFGVEMITLILLIISNCLVFACIKRHIISLIVAIILLLLPLFVKNYCWVTPIEEKNLQIVLVQGNIPQNLKWKPDFIEETINTYISLSIPYFGIANIIIWPESAIPSIELDNNIWLTSLDKLLRLHNTCLITGILHAQPSKKGISNFFNSIIVLGEHKPYRYPTTNRYQKHHLVPFGEFVPLDNIFRGIAPLFNLPMSDFSRGDYHQQQLIAGNVHLTAVICYEIILGSQVRDNFKSNTDFLLTVSNDAWFGNSIGPWQHLQMARMRALELGRPLLRASNNGVTAVITANGEIQKKIPQFTRAVLKTKVMPTSGLTLYARLSNRPMWALVILFIISALLLGNRKKAD
ncbi:MAG: apolipoprotein N-acyltransferase [Candidatus Arsenophonus melophagi]|nr:apolipoprotein N-acyltransferase [Candidatus Arsenophonus melophagi]